MKRNNLMVKVYRTNTETGELNLVRVYPCHHVFTTIDDYSPKAWFIDSDGTEYSLDIECATWNNEHYEITVI